MPRGIFGFKRLFEFGPFTYSADVNSTQDVEEILVDILDERGIEEGDFVPVDEFTEIAEDMTDEIYNDGGKLFNTRNGPVFEEQIFRECLVSRWAEKWEDGFTRSSTGQANKFEELIIIANGCVGIAESGERGIWVLEVSR